MTYSMTSQGHPFGVVGIDRPRQTTRHLSTPNETTWEGDMSLLRWSHLERLLDARPFRSPRSDLWSGCLGEEEPKLPAEREPHFVTTRARTTGRLGWLWGNTKSDLGRLLGVSTDCTSQLVPVL